MVRLKGDSIVVYKNKAYCKHCGKELTLQWDFSDNFYTNEWYECDCDTVEETRLLSEKIKEHKNKIFALEASLRVAYAKRAKNIQMLEAERQVGEVLDDIGLEKKDLKEMLAYLTKDI